MANDQALDIHHARKLAVALALASTLALGACGGSNSPMPAPAASTAAPSEAVTRIGDVSIRASAVQTSTLAEGVARSYGIIRDEHRVLLLVAVRQGPDAEAVALPAQIVATATDLRGRRQVIEMRELRSGDLLDYVGTTKVELPDTLRFEVVVTRGGGATSTVQFNREFYPR